MSSTIKRNTISQSYPKLSKIPYHFVSRTPFRDKPNANTPASTARTPNGKHAILKLFYFSLTRLSATSSAIIKKNHHTSSAWHGVELRGDKSAILFLKLCRCAWEWGVSAACAARVGLCVCAVCRCACRVWVCVCVCV